ncbi:MAG: TIGR01777 family oxidoreductase [Terrimicrobiaceae bacterium]
MNIGITGSSGFIGSRVGELCRAGGHEVVGFSRRPGEGIRLFNRETLPDLSGLDAVVNLAGESIMGLWTKNKKRAILESRILGTRQLVRAMAAGGQKPRVLVNASAIGFYGDTGERLVDETSPCGEGFLAEVAREWEAEAEEAASLGVRVVCLRIGFVLGRGGALKLIAPLFRLGLGGRLGDGKQWMSGVHVYDVAGLIIWSLENDSVRGAVNAVMPEPFRNEEFTRELARAVHRPAFLPAPAFALRLGLGELSHLMLDSTRVSPLRAQEGGYVFRFATLPSALQDALR